MNQRLIGLERLGMSCFRLVKLVKSATASSYFGKKCDFDIPCVPVLNELMNCNIFVLLLS